jgi:hypothetical protein
MTMTRVTRSNEFWRTPCPVRGWVVVRFGSDPRTAATSLFGSFGHKVEATRGRTVPTRHHAPVRFGTREEAEAFAEELNEFGAVAMSVGHSHECGCTE